MKKYKIIASLLFVLSGSAGLYHGIQTYHSAEYLKQVKPGKPGQKASPVTAADRDFVRLTGKTAATASVIGALLGIFAVFCKNRNLRIAGIMIALTAAIVMYYFSNVISAPVMAGAALYLLIKLPPKE